MSEGTYSTIQGTLERITYANEENQYVVGRLQVPGRRELATIVGNLPAVNPGETLRLHGRWAYRMVRSPTDVPEAILSALEKLTQARPAQEPGSLTCLVPWCTIG